MLWPDAPPGGGGPAGADRITALGRMSNITHPFLRVFCPARPNGAAMLIAGGGGYRYIQMDQEGVAAARWLTSLGITAFVLGYRLPREHWHVGRFAPFQDAQRAMRLIRANAATFGVDPARIGALGFSAGGHLLGMCALRPQWRTYAPQDAADGEPASVALVMLLYPVITLEPPYQRTYTRRMMVGEKPTAQESHDWSVQYYMHPGAPPFFLAQAADDRIACPANTALLEEACLRDHVPVERHVFQGGRHAFSMGRPGTDSVAWPGLAALWLRKQQFTG